MDSRSATHTNDATNGKFQNLFSKKKVKFLNFEQKIRSCNSKSKMSLMLEFSATQRLRGRRYCRKCLLERNVSMVRNFAMELIFGRKSHEKKMFSDFENFTNSRN